MQHEFKGWPKIPRWEKESYVITEKIDGSNGCIVITDSGDIFAQSRTKILDESKLGDNFGFCKWVNGNKDDLLRLGPGYHYGEWWGLGINRGYGLKEKRFSLFNLYLENVPECVYQVPVVGDSIAFALDRITQFGSLAAPGYMNPEGLILAANLNRGMKYKIIINS